MNDSNREQLIIAARLLRPLLGELVFVGGTVTGLLITDEAAAGPRTTLDVDAIAEHCCPRRNRPVAWSAENTRLGGTSVDYLGGGLRFEVSWPVQVIPKPG